MEKRIVITGWGAVTPKGLENQDFADSISNKAFSFSGGHSWTTYDIGDIYFGQIPTIDISKYLPMKAPFPNQLSSIAMKACINALHDADLYESELLENTGLIITNTLGPSAEIQNFLTTLFTKGPDRLSPFNFSKATSNSVLGDVSRAFKIKGPSSFVYGEESVVYGIDLIRNEHCDIVVCGGVDEIKELTLFNLEKKKKAVAAGGDSMQEDIINADNNNIFSESAGFVVIETLESALKRNAKIYGEILDYHSYMDTTSSYTIFERDAEQLEFNIEKILQDNEIKKEDSINILGTSCLPWQIKKYEFMALKPLPYKFNYSNIKLLLGEGMSGFSNLNVIAPFVTEPYRPLEYVSVEDIPHNISLGVSPDHESSFTLVHNYSLGGNNTVLLLKKYQ